MPVDQTTVPKFDSSNDRLRRFITVTGPASYVTGGESMTPASIGLGAIHLFNPAPARNAAGTSMRQLAYDPVAQKIQWYGENFNEIANATDLSTYSAVVEVVGR